MRFATNGIRGERIDVPVRVYDANLDWVPKCTFFDTETGEVERVVEIPTPPYSKTITEFRPFPLRVVRLK